MKFLLAMLVYLMIAAMLGWGILLTVKGSPWLLLCGIAIYLLLLIKIGCLPKESH